VARPGRGRRRRGRLLPDEQYRDLGCRRRGRRRRPLTALMRQAIQVLLQRHPGWGLRTLRRAVPGLPRNSTAAYVRRLRRLAARRRQRHWERLCWQSPGAVWAIDGTWLDHAVAPLGRRALVVVELHSRQVLCLESVTGECAAEVERVLAALIEKHGAPLVLKLDNGSGFIARRFAAFCRGHGITLLHSPVRRPRWNGTCEVSGRWAKRRAQATALARGEPTTLTQADLDHAVTFTGVPPRVTEQARDDFQNVVATQLRIAAAEQGLALGPGLGDHVFRSLGRVAVSRALQLCHILTIEGRAFHQGLPWSAA